MVVTICLDAEGQKEGCEGVRGRVSIKNDTMGGVNKGRVFVCFGEILKAYGCSMIIRISQHV